MSDLKKKLIEQAKRSAREYANRPGHESITTREIALCHYGEGAIDTVELIWPLVEASIKAANSSGIDWLHEQLELGKTIIDLEKKVSE